MYHTVTLNCFFAYLPAGVREFHDGSNECLKLVKCSLLCACSYIACFNEMKVQCVFNVPCMDSPISLFLVCERVNLEHIMSVLGGGFGWMAGAINVALNWRWTFRTLGIIGMALIPLAVVALWEPKTVRTRRLARRRGKRIYPIKVVM